MRRRTGLAFVAALLVVAAVASLAAASLLTAWLELATLRHHERGARARFAAESCLRVAAAVVARGGRPRLAESAVPGCALEASRPAPERLELRVRVARGGVAHVVAASYRDEEGGGLRLLGFR